MLATKGNELPPGAFAPIWLRRSAGGLLVPAELTVQEQQAVGRRELQALEVLKRLSAFSVPQLKDWRSACLADGIVSGPTERAQEKAMERVRDALLDAGLIERGMTRGVFVPSDAPDTHKPSPHPTPP